MSKINLLTTVVSMSIAACASQALAQGTATSPSTAHVIDPSTNIVWIGGLNDPINGPFPQLIDLDAGGGPWRKAIGVGFSGMFDGGTLRLRETIMNVGTEPWTDWHEINANIGSHAAIWGAVTDVRVNGTSIGYTANITANTIDLYNFSQLVQPGDVFQIDKILLTLTDNVVGPGTLVASILEYPTIPEPTSASLMLLGCAGLTRRRRWRRP